MKKKVSMTSAGVFFLTASAMFFLGVIFEGCEGIEYLGHTCFTLALIWFLLGCSCKKKASQAQEDTKKTEKKETTVKKSSTTAKKTPSKKTTTTKKTKKTTK